MPACILAAACILSQTKVCLRSEITKILNRWDEFRGEAGLSVVQIKMLVWYIRTWVNLAYIHITCLPYDMLVRRSS